MRPTPMVGPLRIDFVKRFASVVNAPAQQRTCSTRPDPTPVRLTPTAHQPELCGPHPECDSKCLPDGTPNERFAAAAMAHTPRQHLSSSAPARPGVKPPGRDRRQRQALRRAAPRVSAATTRWMWSRAVSSGTTPPYAWCMSIRLCSGLAAR
jgi:hypothetical protein